MTTLDSAFIWYFAYGSNLSVVDEKRGGRGEIRDAVACRLPDHRLTFTKFGRDGTCKANVTGEPGAEVWGVAFRCDREAMAALDRSEGVGGGHYRRQPVTVRSVTGEELEAVTYTAGSKYLCKEGRPTAEYARSILDGARHHGLAEEYVRSLERHIAGLGRPRDEPGSERQRSTSNVELETPRLRLTPFSRVDFDLFVGEMLVDPRVVRFYYSYRDLVADPHALRDKALGHFWKEWEYTRAATDYEIWAAYRSDNPQRLVGWSGLVWTEYSTRYGGPELQYMLAGDFHGRGLATELAGAVLDDASDRLGADTVIAFVDIPNQASVRVLAKLGFEREGQIEAYGSEEMLLYRLPGRLRG